MAGNEGIKPHPENTISLESGHSLELENATAIRMISLVAPHHLLTEESIEGLTDGEIVNLYEQSNYGYRKFTRIRGDLVVTGQEGKGSKRVTVDIEIPGTVYFNGVMEDLESYIRNSRKGADSKLYED